MRKKIWFICLALFITMIFTSCNATNANSKGKIKLGVTSWKENIATANMWKVLLEEKGYKVELMYLEKPQFGLVSLVAMLMQFRSMATSYR